MRCDQIRAKSLIFHYQVIASHYGPNKTRRDPEGRGQPSLIAHRFSKTFYNIFFDLKTDGFEAKPDHKYKPGFESKFDAIRSAQ